MKRRRHGPTRAQLAQQLAAVTREREQFMDLLAEAARERTDLRARLEGVVS